MKKLLIIFIIILISTSISANISVKLDRLYCISAGEYAQLPILLENSYPSLPLGGFDFLIGYDSRLIFNQADAGDLLTTCGWEYFTYSSRATNSIRIVALAETNNDPNHPSCFADSSGTLALLRFQIATDTTFIDDFVPVWWTWSDCGDNSISSSDGNELYISDSVYYFNGANDLYITDESEFPTPYGAPSACVVASSPTPVRMINFLSGGYDISPNGFQVHCPNNIVAVNDSGLCGANIFFEIPLNSQCIGISATSSPESGSFFELGTTNVTTVATDSLGHIDSCYFTITVTDNHPPTIICQQDTTLYTEQGEWWTQLFYNFTATDDCSDVSLASSHPTGSYFSIGTTNVYCTATDSSGNVDTCLFQVTVVDNEAPVLVCPDTIVVAIESQQCGASVEFTIDATDNSTQVSLVTSVLSGSFLPVGYTTIFATATDPYGNADSCEFVVLVDDSEPPNISCISDIITQNDIGACGALVDFSVSATDNCGEPTLTYSNDPNSFFPIGSTLVIVTATDLFDNSVDCQFYVIVADTEPPQISATAQITLPNDFNECGATVDYNYTATDNCDSYSIISSHESGTFFEIGSTLVVLEIIDNAGLTDSTSFVVHIEDTQLPQIDNISDQTIMNDSGSYGAVVHYDPSFSDNCVIVSTTVEPESGTYFELGQSAIVVTALDIHGNLDSSIFYVTIMLQDIDNDQVADFEDNCLTTPNPQQLDLNNDGIGDECCCLGIRGNVNGGDENPPLYDGIDISDIVYLVSYMFGTPRGSAPPCPSEADVDASGELNISDVVSLVAYMFGGSGIPPHTCP